MIYIIHFNQPLHHARHYIGFAEDGNVEARIARHKRGDGARLLRALNERGIGWRVAAVIQGSRTDERRLKNRKKTSAFCPICRGEAVASLEWGVCAGSVVTDPGVDR